MSSYIEAHLNGLPEPRAIVPESLTGDGGEAYRVMLAIVKQRWDAKNPGQAISAGLVFACHEGTPDPSLFLTEHEQEMYFPPAPLTSVQMHGTH